MNIVLKALIKRNKWLLLYGKNLFVFLKINNYTLIDHLLWLCHFLQSLFGTLTW